MKLFRTSNGPLFGETVAMTDDVQEGDYVLLPGSVDEAHWVVDTTCDVIDVDRVWLYQIPNHLYRAEGKTLEHVTNVWVP